MTFLESPELGDPKQVWVEWLANLKKMNKRDASVKFAMERAEHVIREMEILELEQYALA